MLALVSSSGGDFSRAKHRPLVLIQAERSLFGASISRCCRSVAVIVFRSLRPWRLILSLFEHTAQADFPYNMCCRDNELGDRECQEPVALDF